VTRTRAVTEATVRQPHRHSRQDSRWGRPPQSTNFFSALFDFGFNRFVTPMIVKVVYILIPVANALCWLFFVIGGFAGDEPALGVAALLLGWIPALLYLAFFRMTLELYSLPNS
jgi:hypothetical protein